MSGWGNFLQLAIPHPTAHSLPEMLLSLFPSLSYTRTTLSPFFPHNFTKISLRFVNRNISTYTLSAISFLVLIIVKGIISPFFSTARFL